MPVYLYGPSISGLSYGTDRYHFPSHTRTPLRFSLGIHPVSPRAPVRHQPRYRLLCLRVATTHFRLPCVVIPAQTGPPSVNGCVFLSDSQHFRPTGLTPAAPKDGFRGQPGSEGDGHPQCDQARFAAVDRYSHLWPPDADSCHQFLTRVVRARISCGGCICPFRVGHSGHREVPLPPGKGEYPVNLAAVSTATILK